MKLSTGSIDITPHNEVKLCGYINDIRNSQRTTTAHKPIYAMVLNMQIETKQLLFISLDILSIPKNRADEIKKAIVKRYKIDYESIYIHAIHTHSGPSGFSVDAMGKEYENNEIYRKDAIDKIINGLSKVLDDSEEVKAVIGKTQINGYYDNRNDKNAYFDKDAFIIKFLNNKNELVASLVNLNVHSTVLGPYNMEISYDLIGAIREELYNAWKIRPFVCIGTSADISNRHFRLGDDFNELNRSAKGISDILLSIKEYESIDMNSVEIDDFHYRIRYDNKENYPLYENELLQIKNKLSKSLDKTQIKLLLSSKNKYESKLNIEFVDKDVWCKILKFPSLEIITFPGELTSIFGKYLKEKANKKYTFVITCFNDHHGYFIEKEQFGKCYESTATLIPKGETEQIIKELGKCI